ncbi:hypothetical protein G3O06_07630 [Burkholderia sp. Ac-20345]|uniref:hypothetical protein n=1 Tax=Burkholderia sp. Ac-20345 TaxID=2703891 RepID=UPI00197C0A3C|nr:hypothetical protein [Burkholderia sp. Ac-20345]MBN3777420.1 hypothetical protein [Burkholderia sp. Ac-20345]
MSKQQTNCADALTDDRIDAVWSALPGIRIHNEAVTKGIDTRVALRRAFARAILAARFDALPAPEQAAFEIALDALAEYQRNWDTGLPAEYAQGERIAMECACEAVRAALEEARAASANEACADAFEAWHGDPARKVYVGDKESARIGWRAALSARAAGPTDDDKLCAERYRWLRAQYWNESSLFVVAGHHSLVRLGADCPNGERLDAVIDAARVGESR